MTSRIRYLIHKTNETYESLMRMPFMDMVAYAKMYEKDDEEAEAASKAGK